MKEYFENQFEVEIHEKLISNPTVRSFLDEAVENTIQAITKGIQSRIDDKHTAHIIQRNLERYEKQEKDLQMKTNAMERKLRLEGARTENEQFYA